MVGSLPEDIRARHKAIYDEAITKAKARGWDPEVIANEEDCHDVLGIHAADTNVDAGFCNQVRHAATWLWA